MVDYTTAYIFLGLLIVIIAAAKKYSTIKVRKINAFGLEGSGIIHRVVELDLVKDGQLLKDVMTGRDITVVSNTVEFVNKKGKEKRAYLVDLDKGCTLEIEKDESLIKVRTDPDMIGSVIDSRIISDAFNIKPSRGMILAASLVGMAAGLIIGKAI